MLRAIHSLVLLSYTLVKSIASVPSLPEGIAHEHHVTDARPINVDDPRLGTFGELYRDADQALFLLDSSDTLRISDWNTPQKMAATHQALTQLGRDRKNKIVINSGLPVEMTKKHYAGVPNLEIYGEYGSTRLTSDGSTVPTYTDKPWMPVSAVKQDIERILIAHGEKYGIGHWKRWPGTNLFANKNTLLWGYERMSNDRGETYHNYHIAELAQKLEEEIQATYGQNNWAIKVKHSLVLGVIEFLPPSADKGLLAEHLLATELSRGGKSLAVSIGNGPPDESMHRVMNANGHHSIIVLQEPRQRDQTHAHFSLKNVYEVHQLFQKLANN